jgi:transcriptional regulator with PAS, ATPase and Fis domain
MQRNHNKAYKDKPGLLDYCKAGSVFLDEVDKLDNVTQDRLLTFLNKPHEYYTLGDVGLNGYV